MPPILQKQRLGGWPWPPLPSADPVRAAVARFSVQCWAGLSAPMQKQTPGGWPGGLGLLPYVVEAALQFSQPSGSEGVPDLAVVALPVVVGLEYD